MENEKTLCQLSQQKPSTMLRITLSCKTRYDATESLQWSAGSEAKRIIQNYMILDEEEAWLPDVGSYQRDGAVTALVKVKLQQKHAVR